MGGVASVNLHAMGSKGSIFCHFGAYVLTE